MLIGAGVSESVVLRDGRLSKIQEFLDKVDKGTCADGADCGIDDALNEHENVW